MACQRSTNRRPVTCNTMGSALSVMFWWHLQSPWLMSWLLTDKRPCTIPPQPRLFFTLPLFICTEQNNSDVMPPHSVTIWIACQRFTNRRRMTCNITALAFGVMFYTCALRTMHNMTITITYRAFYIVVDLTLCSEGKELPVLFVFPLCRQL